jgi:hypothetical protein
MLFVGAWVFDPIETAAKTAGKICRASTPTIDGVNESPLEALSAPLQQTNGGVTFKLMVEATAAFGTPASRQLEIFFSPATSTDLSSWSFFTANPNSRWASKAAVLVARGTLMSLTEWWWWLDSPLVLE